MGNPSESVDGLENNDDIRHEGTHQHREDNTENEYFGRSISDIVDDIPFSDKLRSGKELYKCEECGASYKSKSGLWHYTSSKHVGICYFCNYCEYKATRQDNLKQHQEAIHDGVRAI